MKTARFTELVEEAGAPKPYLLWVSPKQDPGFQRAAKEHRILTIHQENVGTKKDYGMVGFHEEPNAQYLIFPKSLKAFAERRIIGINYDLLAKESRPGKPPAIERRVPATRAAKKERLKPATETAGAAVQSESDENIIAFEAPVEKSAPVRTQGPKPSAASKPTAPKRTKQSKFSGGPKSRGRLKPATDPESEKSAGIDQILDSRVLAAVRRAMKDLDAGKTVAAYKRLEALVEEAEKEDG